MLLLLILLLITSTWLIVCLVFQMLLWMAIGLLFLQSLGLVVNTYLFWKLVRALVLLELCSLI